MAYSIIMMDFPKNMQNTRQAKKKKHDSPTITLSITGEIQMVLRNCLQQNRKLFWHRGRQIRMIAFPAKSIFILLYCILSNHSLVWAGLLFSSIQEFFQKIRRQAILQSGSCRLIREKEKPEVLLRHLRLSQIHYIMSRGWHQVLFGRKMGIILNSSKSFSQSICCWFLVNPYFLWYDIIEFINTENYAVVQNYFPKWWFVLNIFWCNTK